MHVLVVYANPNPASFGAAVRDAAVAGCRAGGHDVTVLDLYAIDFDPCLGADEHRRYLDIAVEHPDPVVRQHIDHVRRAQGLVFCYPTWWSGMPAVLKGWLERVLLPGVAFELDAANRVRPALTQIEVVAGITTLGGPRWESLVLGNGGRRTVCRTVRAVAGRRCRTRWLALHRLDDCGQDRRQQFLDHIDHTMRRL